MTGVTSPIAQVISIISPFFLDLVLCRLNQLLIHFAGLSREPRQLSKNAEKTRIQSSALTEFRDGFR